MEAIELQNVSKNFGGVAALSDLNLGIRPGELTALLGPNRAGKTTAISLMLAHLGAGAGAGAKSAPGQRAQADRVDAAGERHPAGVDGGRAGGQFANAYPAPLPVEGARAPANLHPVACTLWRRAVWRAKMPPSFLGRDASAARGHEAAGTARG